MIFNHLHFLHKNDNFSYSTLFSTSQNVPHPPIVIPQRKNVRFPENPLHIFVKLTSCRDNQELQPKILHFESCAPLERQIGYMIPRLALIFIDGITPIIIGHVSQHLWEIYNIPSKSQNVGIIPIMEKKSYNWEIWSQIYQEWFNLYHRCHMSAT